MKSVAVTGADGFIGSHLVELLLSKGLKVRALSQYNSFNNWGWLEEIAPADNLDVWSGDVRDPNFCRRFVEGADTVFHLAALIAIPYSYIAPDSYVDTNIKGTLNICEAVKENGSQKLLVTSTSEVYGTAKYVPIDEKHPKQPQSPYSATKIGADALALSFHNAFKTDVTVVRPFNTYGPRQSARAIIPTIITQIASGVKEIKVGDLSPTRDFNFVTDTCRGFYEISQAEKTAGEEINIATGHEISMETLFKTIARIMKADVVWKTDPERLRPKDSEVFRLLGDNKKITSLTDWKPQVSLEEGLEKTVRWICDNNNLRHYKPYIYNR
ncbi:MAG: SDR family NAD(P)-dependent oxidoreductase [Muribaculaceae bacterium]|nr:SDR family NAD(P)-dependent oxidoreductase [Muribaculaceae bacterium]